MIPVQKIMPENEICRIIKCVDTDQMRTLTHLRKMLETKELASQALLRTTLKQYCKGCICENTVFILAGISLQHGAKIDECTLCCFETLKQLDYENKKKNYFANEKLINKCCSEKITERNCNFENVKMYLQMMCNVSSGRGICPISKERRNWLASLLNRNDAFEGGIVPVPEVFMKDITSNIRRAVSTGSHLYYKGMVYYAKLADCNTHTCMLKLIVDFGVSFLDLTPILYSIQEGGDTIKQYVIKVIGETEPKNEEMREALVKLSNIISSLQ